MDRFEHRNLIADIGDRRAAYSTGLRLNEVYRLQASDIDLAAGTVTVRSASAKGGRERTVTRVLAQPGQSIQPGDVLLVLEAMKMETNITAPIAGKVASLPVKPGDAVQGGQVLVAFE